MSAQGHKRGQHSLEALKQWIPYLNKGVKIRKEPKHSSVQGWFRCTCAKSNHKAFRTIDAVNEQRRHAIECRVCCDKGNSKWEKRLYSLLDRMGLSYGTEAAVFAGQPAKTSSTGMRFHVAFHLADVLLSAHPIAIEVDGEQHFGDGMHGHTPQGVGFRDNCVNDTVLYGSQPIKKLVRLAYSDTRAQWQATIVKALLAGPEPCVFFSPSYKCADLKPTPLAPLSPLQQAPLTV